MNYTTSQEVELWMNERIHLLERDIKRVRRNLKQAPDGVLSISKGNRATRYYQVVRSSPGEPKKTYISINNQQLIRRLAQKSYDQKVLKAMEVELKIWRQTAARIKRVSARREQLFSTISDDRKQLVVPLELTPEMREQAWAALSFPAYTRYQENLQFLTKKGHMVRSKSEAYIADELYLNGIEYKYECPLTLELENDAVLVQGNKINGGVNLEYMDLPKEMRVTPSFSGTPTEGSNSKKSVNHRSRVRQKTDFPQPGKTVTIHPDFTIFLPAENKVLFWEHNGVLDDPEYVRNFVRKMSWYRRAGLLESGRLINTYEAGDCPLDYAEVNSIIASLKARATAPLNDADAQ